MSMPDPDKVHRTVLLGLHDGSQPTIKVAQAAHAATGLILIADKITCRDRVGQAALLAAVAAGVRAFGTVQVVAESLDDLVLGGIHSGRTLRAALINYGVVLSTADNAEAASAAWPTLLIGDLTPAPNRPKSAPVLRVTWVGWTAHVHPTSAQIPTPRARPACVLAAIAAGAIGVSEAFGIVRAEPGSDAGYRNVALNLWSPGDDREWPALAFAPTAWWLVGLGHLGQAYGWVISWLNYVDRSRIQIVLQDVDRTTPANHSTGVLTPAGSTGAYKTRLVANALDGLGFDTRIIERRLDNGFHVQPADQHVALLGVDNLVTRGLTSEVGWHLAIDVGLGSGATDFRSILLRRFPGTVTSDQVTGWKNINVGPVRVPDSPGFADLERRDACGVVQLAGKAVGAAFVGLVAACLAVSEAVRELHDGSGFDIVTLDLGSLDSTRAPTADQSEVVATALTT